MKKHLIAIIYLIFVIAASADELEVKSKSRKQLQTFMDVLGTDESSHRTYFIPKDGSYGMSMNDSINKCHNFGLRLVTIDSKAEHDWLLQTLVRNNVGFYVGLTRGTNDTWNRINDLGVIDFDLNFHYGEPNNQSGDEDCIEILSYYGLQFQLNDVPCNVYKSFVCVLY